ncbi:type I restriction-modification system subunit M N-terminal domain-containing protein, partial [Pseudomonas viridiflava]|uniref:type I restriction-modification system subunit M N-terminal domain-containing protein n=1 Tax=Pseudomonas viridiflava TaxID=33069 RepID=UPI001F11B154
MEAFNDAFGDNSILLPLPPDTDIKQLLHSLCRMTTQDIVGKLWNLCNVLKDDGVTYHQYVTELTYLLFLKMADETGQEDQLADGCHWSDLLAQNALKR